MNVRALNTPAFLNVFIVFGLLLAFFVLAYFFIGLIKDRVNFDKRRSGKNWAAFFDFALGAAFGSGTFACAFIQRFFIQGLPTVIIVDFVFVAAWLFSYRFFLCSCLLALGALLYNRTGDANGNEWIMNVVFLAVCFLIMTGANLAAKRFIWIRTGVFLIFILLVCHATVVVVLYLVAAIRPSADFYLINVLASFLFAVFGYWLGLLIDRVLFGTKKLSSLARFDYDVFVKQTFAAEDLHAYIARRGVTHGALLSFFIAAESAGTAERALYNAVKTRYANKERLLISLASRYPTVFIPIQGNFRKVSELESAVRALSSVAVVDLKSALGESLVFKAFFSIYGIHNDTAAGLLRINLNYLLSPNSLSRSRLNAYDPVKERMVEQEAAAVSDFLEASASWNIEYSIRKVTSFGSNVLYAAQLTSVPLTALNSEQCFARMEQRYLWVAQRYFAMKILRTFFSEHVTGSIVVNYPIALFLSRDFSFRDFASKVEAQGFDLKRIVFCLNLLTGPKPSALQLRRLFELANAARLDPLFAVCSDTPTRAVKGVHFVMGSDGAVFKNHLVAEMTLKVDYHKKVY